jgi:hypothetical protein
MDHPEKSKRQPIIYSRKWLLIFVIGCAVLLYASLRGLGVLMLENSYTVCFRTPFPSDENVEKTAFFELPSSARNLVYDAYNANGACRVWIKFEIDSEDLEVFQNSTLIENFETNRIIRDESFKLSMQEKGWTQSTYSIAGSGNLNDYFYTSQWIFIDTTNPSSFVVYIILRQERR